MNAEKVMTGCWWSKLTRGNSLEKCQLARAFGHELCYAILGKELSNYSVAQERTIGFCWNDHVHSFLFGKYQLQGN
jgi:hypothetical protein